MALERGVLARTVGFARRVGIHTLLGEGLLVGASAGLLVLWLGLVSGTQALGMEGLFLGGLAALMAAAAWVKGGWRDESSWARILDERLGLDGALLAGLQVERRGGSELGRLLTRDVQGRVRRKEILGKALPVRLWLVGLLVGSGSLLFHGLQQTRVPELRWQEATVVLGGATEELQDALRRAQELPEGELTPESLQELKALGAEVQKMELSQHLGQEQPEDWVQPLREIGERLDRLARDMAGDRSLDQKLERAQGLLSAVQERAKEQAGPRQGTDEELASKGGPGPQESKGRGPEPGSTPTRAAGEGVQAAMGGAGDPGTPASGAGESGTEAPDQGPVSVSAPGAAATPVGAVAKPPRAYRGVLERWVLDPQ